MISESSVGQVGVGPGWTLVEPTGPAPQQAWKEAIGSDPVTDPAPLALPFPRTSSSAEDHDYVTVPLVAPDTSGVAAVTSPSDCVIAAFIAYLARLSGQYDFYLAFSEEVGDASSASGSRDGMETPFRLALSPSAPVETVFQRVAADLTAMRQRKALGRGKVADVSDAEPPVSTERAGRPAVLIHETPHVDDYRAWPGSDLVLVISPDGRACRLAYDRGAVPAAVGQVLPRRIGAFLGRMLEKPRRPLSALPLLDAEEQRRVLVDWNDTFAEIPDLCVHQAVEKQASATPSHPAVHFRGRELTYRELNARANRLARHLVALGASPDRLVGLFVERSLDMVVGLLAILKSGSAYLPLDPHYPPERLRFMVDDAGVGLILTQSDLAGRLATKARVVQIDADAAEFDSNPADNLATDVTADHLAYVIYTSGSTGTPKGVMVTHRNVVNFFVGMDARIPHEPPGVWLAVTSLSFDISVLELIWTLARGFKVMLHAQPSQGEGALDDVPDAAAKTMEFSLFYFASDEGKQAADRYRLLLEGAKFADRSGFSAVWSPERHFHAFGGLYPNPSVTSAAIAALTERVKIRAGSCVVPLHSPIRVAEEWALVDNLSRGRVGISFASGWQPNDFVIAPQNFANRKETMLRNIDIVRRLWRGESIAFPGPSGKEVQIRTLPRPVQQELPVWITAAGNPETFRQAGEMGANLLTHLLGQTVEELGEKLGAYRQSWRDSGHQGVGHVTLMLHSFVGDDDGAVREIVREPMKEYLRSSVDLIRRAAWTFPPFARRAASTGKSPTELFDAKDLSASEMDALLDHAFERYFETSGLFGTPATCVKMAGRLAAIGVDEIACLIDFGIESEQVLEHLDHLKAVKDLVAGQSDGTQFGILGQIEAYGVTHLQCTPSLAKMLVSDGNRSALGSLRALMIGGEAFLAALAEQLRPLVKGELLNMYGPTETTIWSTTQRVEATERPVPLGSPISNTRLYVLDPNLQPLPPSVPGELFIGGAGVVRGYLHRPELTRERFIADPFDAAGRGRLYRTGDVVRRRSDGVLEFLGRTDHQVKIRGHRVELGEIESVLGRQPGVSEAVVVAREDEPGVKRLAAYIVARRGATVEAGHVQSAVKAVLPDFMVPAHVTLLEKMPLTPNGKVDRAALPAPRQATAMSADCEPPRDELEAAIAAIWQEALNVPRVGRTENFFQLGGDSLLAVAVHRKLCDALSHELAITEMFLSPTVAGLADIVRPAKGTATPPAMRSPLVTLAADGHGAPWFIVHGLTGVVLNLRALGVRLGGRRPVYGVQARGVDGAEPPLDRIEDMAAYYIDHLRRVQPRGPYLLAGFCFGGVVAFEMAQQLSRRGEAIALLALLNSAFEYRFLSPLGRLRFQLAKQLIHARTLRALSARERLAYVRAKLTPRLAQLAPALAKIPYVDQLPDAQNVPAELRDVTAAAEQAFYHYEPRVYGGRLTSVQPMHRDFRNILDFSAEWARKAAGGVETVYVSGDHLTMLDVPAVDVLAERLNERVEALGAVG